ncbi:Rab family GTPase YPT11 Ecym_2048 [Eremothecium cymbalariae DBVPG|uniref:GTP-binding protein YPT11 n=1 Tax=Eremothecium cymbalariae (strain CBS 270.75 / DBVPG 7215 / KCTC 17166 / NRRL Y-17582) TaxID=931890 RepID=G8JP05_ERECY|nr:Hypothetical protein Ecym_2048 [Eremothecium cymbalariae DBVPG\
MPGRRKHYSLNGSATATASLSHPGAFRNLQEIGGVPKYDKGLHRRALRSSSHASTHESLMNMSQRNVSFNYGYRSPSSNIKTLLIGDAGVGKTAMILSYSDDLPTRSQLWQHSPQLASPDLDKQTNKRLKTIDVRKRYSLNDYEELFSLSHVQANVDWEEQEEEDPDEVMIETKSTIGIDIKTNLVDLDHRLFKINMWDTAGQERYRNAMIPSLYKGTHGIILSYDICNFSTFQSCLNHWLPEALESCNVKKTRFYLVGNKVDLYKDRQVTHKDAAKLIEEVKNIHGVEISGNFELSCKWRHVVQRAFNLIIKDLVEHGCYEDNEPEINEVGYEEQDSGDQPKHLNEKEHDPSDSDAMLASTNSGTYNATQVRRGSTSSLQKRRSSGHLHLRKRSIDITKPKYNEDLSGDSSISSCCI